jgi:hypothetical protein
MKSVRELALPTFDLSEVMKQVRADPIHSDWPEERFVQAELEYRQFLSLCRSNPGQKVMPTRLGDAVWHQHILNTKLYVDDCRSYLGYYLHHLPRMPDKDIVEASHRLFGDLASLNGIGGTREEFVVMCYCTDGPHLTIQEAMVEQEFMGVRMS